ncbi:MAG: NAD(+)--dinitrogen-reductase ADP-D-ribosyltransferase [Sulfuricella denitrificans]|nr:NAD(+)--dinitrogen-reductase ADP-D-ribosyltransferase [Sulfuricella denitrificans]
MERTADTFEGHSTNLTGIPSGLLASTVFNDFPLPLHINGVREMNRPLFEMLARSTSTEEAADAFQNYMGALFGLDSEQRLRPANHRRFRSSYLRLLQGWGFDANGPEGAVLKGWVESRFGLFPTFHKETLGRYASAGWMTYVEEKMSSRFHNNSINLQLDLLYEYCQISLARYFAAGRKHLTLYRGVNDFNEHPIRKRQGKDSAIVRQNNLVSFTSDRLRADEFGDCILEARVPVVKVLFFNGLVSGTTLKGEGEYLVIGGDYQVRFSYL